MKRLFNPKKYGRELHVLLAKHCLSYRMAAKEIGPSSATLHRVCNGKPPDVETYLRIEAWKKNGDPSLDGKESTTLAI